ncbi:MAG TPA: hypothetical protein VES21_14410 [Nocardioidaceae bacterium]|nr:hypothetical protein [Nocardioidaceae bacterium]
MTEPPREQSDELDPMAADTDHDPSDFAAGGYDDRQQSGDSSAGESVSYERGNTGDASSLTESVAHEPRKSGDSSLSD